MENRLGSQKMVRLCQLLVEVNFKDGKRDGLNKIWDDKGNLIKLDFGVDNIKQYIKDYFNSSSNLDIIEGNYSVYQYSGKIRLEKSKPYYEFSIIRIYDKYYAIMTKPFKNSDATKKFSIGDVKVFISKKEQSNTYSYKWLMGNKTTYKAGELKYNLKTNSIKFHNLQGTDDLKVFFKSRF